MELQIQVFKFSDLEITMDADNEYFKDILKDNVTFYFSSVEINIIWNCLLWITKWQQTNNFEHWWKWSFSISGMKFFLLDEGIRTQDSIPNVMVTFPDGYTDRLVLSKHYFNEEDRIHDDDLFFSVETRIFVVQGEINVVFYIYNGL